VCGRTVPTGELGRDLEDLRARTGAQISVIVGDIADPATAQRALAAARDGARLRGVIHAASVVEDATIDTLDRDLLTRVWRGKAEGAWTLHRATLDQDLDFFVVYSSLAALIGSPGQAAYAAANAFLDGLVAYRAANGLPATSIQWGAWSHVGRGRHLQRRGFLMIRPEEGLDAFARILTEGHHQIAYSPIDVAQWTAPYPALRNSTLLTRLLGCAPHPAAGTESGGSRVRETLLAADTPAQRRRVLEQFIIGQARDLLGGTERHIASHTNLVILGLDSLGAVQLQQRLSTALQTDIKPGVIWVKPSAAALASWLLDAMGLPADQSAR
jgi:phthiocerol/phenolphthiocerol synthesis type-I polyketide synthase D